MNSPAKFKNALRDFAERLRADGNSSYSYFEDLAQVVEAEWPSAAAMARLESFLNPGAQWQDANFTGSQIAQYVACWELGRELKPRRIDFDMKNRQEVIAYLAQRMESIYDAEHVCSGEGAFWDNIFIIHCSSDEGVPQAAWQLHSLWFAGEEEVEDGEAESVGEVLSASMITIHYCPFCGERLERGGRA